MTRMQRALVVTRMQPPLTLVRLSLVVPPALPSSPLGKAGVMDEDVRQALIAGDPEALMTAGAKALPLEGAMAHVSKATSALGIDKGALMALASGDTNALVEIAVKNFKVGATRVVGGRVGGWGAALMH